MHIVSIDVGVRNFALVIATVDIDATQIIDVFKYDLMNQGRSHGGNGKGGGLMREVEGLCYVLDKHRLDFLKADVVIVERQPPAGLLSIQSVLYDRFRDKIALLMPQKMHRHFSIHQLDYEGRKEAVCTLARPYLREPCVAKLNRLVRKHDIADAVCFAVYYGDLWRTKQKKNPFYRHAFRQNFQLQPQLVQDTKVVMGSSAERV